MSSGATWVGVLAGLLGGPPGLGLVGGFQLEDMMDDGGLTFAVLVGKSGGAGKVGT